MNKKQRSGLPLFSTRMTATISVALVLLILGATAMLGIAGSGVVNDIRRHMGFTVMLDEGATASDVALMKQRLSKARYVESYAYSSPDDVMMRWQQMVGDDENISELMEGVNPFAPEFEVHVRALWSDPDSLAALAGRLEMVPGVSDVKVHTEMVRQVHSTLRSIAAGATCVAVVLLVIAFVLINNTVRLTVYSRRFTIHTMKLVGATGAFIRRPIVRANTFAGFLAAVVSAGVLAGCLAWARSLDGALAAAVGWDDAAWVFAGMIVAGCLLCYLAATLATNKYLRLGHDDMYR